MQIAAVVASHLTYKIGDQPVIDDFSFSIPAGKMVGVLGPNGSGKSTLIKILVGLLPQSAGTIKIFGTHPKAISAGQIAYVGQKLAVDSFFPATVQELLAIPRWSALSPSARTALIKTLGLAGLLQRSFNSLSGGEKQRVILARALIGNPKLLVLDEPTDGLDPTTRREFYHFLKTQQVENNITILLVSHDVHGISPILDAAICLRHESVCHGEEQCLLSGADLKNAFHSERQEIVKHHH